MTGLFLANSLGSAGLIATTTVAAIVGAELSGRTWMAGFPGAAFQVGGALTALLVAFLVSRFGRRNGMTLAGAIGVVGMAAASVAVMMGELGLLLAALAIAGTASAAVRFARFTAAEIVPKVRRGRAVAVVVTAGTVGSVLGPALVAPTGAWSASLGMGALAGPYIAATVLYIAAAAAFYAFLRPEPGLLAAQLESPDSDNLEALPARSWRELAADPGVVTAMIVLVISQGVMVMLMGITSLHMHSHDHSLSLISLVFSGHTLGMFAFSILSGYAADRWGRKPVIVVGGLILALSCILAPLSPAFVPIFIALFLLGYGWNLCYVAGSAMLSDYLSAREKAATQGVTDLAMGLVSAASTITGGAVFAISGFTAMSLAGFVASLLLLVVIFRFRLSSNAVPGQA